MRAILVQQDLRPDGNAQAGLADHAGSRRGTNDASVFVAGASGTIAAAADDATMGLDLDLQNRAVLGAWEWLEGQATSGATTLLGRQIEAFLHAGKGGMVPPLGTGLLTLLPARARRFWGRVGSRGGVGGSRNFIGSGRRLGLTTETVLFELADASLGHGEFLFEFEDARGGFLAAASLGLGELELENFDVGGGTLVHALVEVGQAASLDKRNRDSRIRAAGNSPNRLGRERNQRHEGGTNSRVAFAKQRVVRRDANRVADLDRRFEWHPLLHRIRRGSRLDIYYGLDDYLPPLFLYSPVTSSPDSTSAIRNPLSPRGKFLRQRTAPRTLECLAALSPHRSATSPKGRWQSRNAGLDPARPDRRRTTS